MRKAILYSFQVGSQHPIAFLLRFLFDLPEGESGGPGHLELYRQVQVDRRDIHRDIYIFTYIYCRCNSFCIFPFYCIHRSSCTKRCLNPEWPIIIASIYIYQILLFLDLINSVLKSLSEEMYRVLGDQLTCSSKSMMGSISLIVHHSCYQCYLSS